MDKKSRYNKSNQKQYLKYFQNLLSGRERHTFEKEVMQDKFEQEAFEGISQISADELKKDLHDLQNRIKKRSQTRPIIALPLFRYAAAILLLLGTGAAIYFIHKSLKNVSQLAKLEIKEDSSLIRKEMAKEDSLKNNIAFVSSPKKEIKKARISDIKPVISEVSPVQYTESHETNEISAASGEIINEEAYSKDQLVTTDNVMEQVPETKKYDYDESVEQEETMLRDKKRRELYTEKSRAAFPSGIQSTGTTITGRILSSADETPLPGVNIIVKGTSTGTVSDINGDFQLTVPPSENPVLQFACIGYTTEEMEISDYNDVTIELSEDLVALDEVVVVGYGTMKNSDVTGAAMVVEDASESNTPPTIMPPKPVNGLSSYKVYIKENIKYNKLPVFEKPVVVKLSFTVNKNGSVQNITVKKSAGEEFDKEAVRLVKEGPRWNPGTENGIPVSREVTIKIKFQPEETIQP
jgi:TonB family protein